MNFGMPTSSLRDGIGALVREPTPCEPLLVTSDDARWVSVTTTFEAGEHDGAPVVDRLSGALFAVGAQGFEVRADGLVATFFTASSAEDLATRVSETLEADGLGSRRVRVDEIPEADWWPYAEAHHAPLVFGPLAVVPSWAPEPEGAPHVLRLTPSTAFGTGVHPTTAICLRALVAEPPTGRVLDVGTGTGILALAAAALGAREVAAVDIDPAAVEAARANVAAHDTAARIVVGDDLEAHPGPFDLVIANVRAAPLEALAPQIARRLADGGRLLLCGLYADEVDRVRRVYGALGLTLDGGLEEGMWRGLTRRPRAP